MFRKNYSLDGVMGCCNCFGFVRKPKPRPTSSANRNYSLSQEYLLYDEIDDNEDDKSCNGESIDHEEEVEFPNSLKRCEDILKLSEKNGLICRQFPVKETYALIRTTDENGNRMINEYVRECKIGAGSYGKVVMYRNTLDGKKYAIKVFHKSHLAKQRVSPTETAMTDVLREVVIMKMIEHPNIVNLIEVINDPNTDNFYMVLEYVDGNWVWDSSGNPLEESLARKYLRDLLSGLMYLHSHNIVHLDIKPENLLVTSKGVLKIGDFSVSQVFQDENDELQRSPGTPVFTAPECCLGLSYRGKAADTWAVGVTLYFMTVGGYPFLGESLQDQYDKIVNNSLILPPEMDPSLRDLLEGLLCKDPNLRMSLIEVANHAWVCQEGPLSLYVCRCKSRIRRRESQHDVLQMVDL